MPEAISLRPASTHDAGTHHPGRTSGSLPSRRAQRRYRVVLGILIVLAVGFGFGLLAWDNPMPFGTPGFWRIAELRGTSIIVMAVVAICQAMATVAFQTATNNRIITPSIMGFESLYIAVQTGAVFFLGAAGVTAVQGVPQFVLQILIMVGLSMALYGWLLSGKYGNIHVMLLVGIIIGGGLSSVSAFMQRLLSPSEFDVLTARLFGSVSNADASYLPIAIPLCLGAGALLLLNARRLNVVALGADTTTNLGLNHRFEVMRVLFLVSILMATSTALVGPMTFLGFLVATLAYQLADSHDHRYVFPVAVLTGFVVLAGSYFVMKNVFYAEGVVSIIIEVVGGSVFLFFILRKGRL
ncbi:iron chelate uptake ABC transporter family permease subunit [Arthrobacter sp. HY1533]|uniref:iron chelate uptake ABC transporter family permease subunit n=1 Tax=Arthrobacter sp. HY1533 TaxID=2970919 RepID=UPI0022BA00AF|nr:iron chelate uptake ABC transporter family permease subunit [Arthrobacter sp. HY1533]